MDCTVESTESSAERDRRVDLMLRDMVVEEALLSIKRGRAPRQFSLPEISDFVGAGPATILRIEESALKKLKKHMV